MDQTDLTVMGELAPGTYYLGDPLTISNENIDFENMFPGIYEKDHMSFAFGYTGFMEGSCYDRVQQVTYKIEHGLFGMIPLSFCNTAFLDLYGTTVTYHDPVVFYSDGQGYFEILSTNYSYTLDTRVDPFVLKQSEEDYDY